MIPPVMGKNIGRRLAIPCCEHLHVKYDYLCQLKDNQIQEPGIIGHLLLSNSKFNCQHQSLKDINLKKF